MWLSEREKDENKTQLEGVSGCIWGMLVMCLPHFAWGLEGNGAGARASNQGPRNRHQQPYQKAPVPLGQPLINTSRLTFASSVHCESPLISGGKIWDALFFIFFQTDLNHVGISSLTIHPACSPTHGAITSCRK